MHPRDAAAPTSSTASAASLVVAVTSLLQQSGESTSVTLAGVERMNRALNTNFELAPGWSAVTLIDRGAPEPAPPHIASAPATGISMKAVAILMGTVDRLNMGSAARDQLATALSSARRARPANIWLFVLACSVGAGALAVIFGAHDPTAVVVAAGSAAVGGAIRRLMGWGGFGPVAQVFVAALIAGVIGGLAVTADLSSSLRLISVCPAMILVPGPHILNGALDLIGLRVSLGIARLSYAAMLLLAIGTGLAIGLAVCGTVLPASPPAREVALWVDVLAAAAAAASFPIFFSMPYRLIFWPVAVGAVAHGLRWYVMEVWGWNIVVGAFVACLFVGAVLAPVAHIKHIPFAAIGFAAVVSLVPGVYVFRTVDVFAQIPFTGTSPELLGAISDGSTALFIIVGMAAGLVIPMRASELLHDRTP